MYYYHDALWCSVVPRYAQADVDDTLAGLLSEMCCLSRGCVAQVKITAHNRGGEEASSTRVSHDGSVISMPRTGGALPAATGCGMQKQGCLLFTAPLLVFRPGSETSGPGRRAAQSLQ